jgi:hypothetical protein
MKWLRIDTHSHLFSRQVNHAGSFHLVTERLTLVLPILLTISLSMLASSHLDFSLV